MLVISLVVWLIVVFFSVTTGLEKNWINRLIALTAPVRITPTEAYYDSYYYRVDSLSAASDYTPKNLGEKRDALSSDPYDPDMDPEIPKHWPRPDQHSDGTLKNLVGEAFAAAHAIKDVSGLRAADFEITTANVRLTLLREELDSPLLQPDSYVSYISQNSYVSSFDGTNPQLMGALLPLQSQDLDNVLHVMAIAPSSVRGDHPGHSERLAAVAFQQRAKTFFSQVNVHSLRTPTLGWTLPSQLVPTEGSMEVCAVKSGPEIHHIVIPTNLQQLPEVERQLEYQGYPVMRATVQFTPDHLLLKVKDLTVRSSRDLPIVIPGGTEIPAHFVESSLATASTANFLHFAIQLPLQGVNIEGEVPYMGLRLGQSHITQSFDDNPSEAPPWVYRLSQLGENILPSHHRDGDGVLLAKHFIDNGVRVGDRGYLSYYTPTASSYQEQRLPVYVAGFYDPGIIPIGGKFIMVTRDVTSVIRAINAAHGDLQGNGINVWMDELADASHVKAELQREFKRRGIERYWHVETYEEYDFTRAIIQQIRSDKNLWSLMSLIIIVVACSNIITMLILLVNDKRVEIGILRAMGASNGSIAFIFGLAGAVMGIIGNLLGVTAALFTLHNLQALLALINRIQGHELLNSAFFGEVLPNEVSSSVLLYVGIATVLISLVAGLIPAIKASLLKPSAVLRAE